MRINNQIQEKKKRTILICNSALSEAAHFLAVVDLWQVYQILFRALIYGSSAVVRLETDPKLQVCQCHSQIKFANQVQVLGVQTRGQARKMPRMSLSQPRMKSCAVFKYEILVFRGLFCRLKRGIRFLCSVIRKKKNAHVRKMRSHLYFSFVHEKDQ